LQNSHGHVNYFNAESSEAGFSVRCIKDPYSSGSATVITSTTTDLTFSTAVSGGNVLGDGGTPITSRGVCWSTSQNPTLADNHTSDGSGTGTFTSYLSELIPNTQYYIRSYAINSVGTSYGNQLSFLTPQAVVLSTPNGGEIWKVGSRRQIQWSNTTIDSVSLEYSVNGGISWNLIVPCLPGHAHSFTWTIPNVPSNNCLVRISDKNNPLFYDISNNAFSIIPFPVWHVATTGNDLTGNGTKQKPFQTIQKAVNSCVKGDSIKVAQGIYFESIVSPSGDFGYYLTGGYDSVTWQRDLVMFQSIIDPGFQNNGIRTGMGSINPDSMVVDGFKIRNAHYALWTPAFPSIWNGVIRNCVIDSCICAGYFYYVGSIVLENCFISNCQNAGFIFDNPLYATIRNCVFTNTQWGIYSFRWNAHLLTILNSTFNNCTKGLLIADVGMSSHIVRNNIFTNCSDAISYSYCNLIDISYNDFYNNLNNLGSCQDNGTNIYQNPLFMDQQALDFRLSNNSPCKSAGSFQYSPGFDIAYNARPCPQGTTPDMGAYETCGQLEVNTGDATQITQNGAIIQGAVNSGYQTAEIFFEYGFSTNYGHSIPGEPDTVTGYSLINVQGILEGLTMNNIYHFRMIAVANGDTVFGQDRTFDLIPTPSISGPLEVCQGSETVYNTESGKNNYLWEILPDGIIIQGGTISDDSITIVWNNPGLKTIGLNYQNSSGTFAPSPITLDIVVIPLPIATALSNSPVCTDNELHFVGASSLAPASYLWTGPDGWSSTEPMPIRIPPVKGIYYLTTTVNSCTSAPTSTNVIVFNKPIAIASSNSPICSGQTLYLYGTSPSISIYSWNWTGPDGWISNEQNPTIQNPVVGIYSLTVTDNNCTSDPFQTIVILNNDPSVNIEAIPSNNTNTGGSPATIYLSYGPQSVTLATTTTGGSGFTYSWTSSTLGLAGLSCTLCANPVFTPTEEGRYTFTVTVTNSEGCASAASIEICVLDIHVPGTNNKVYLCHNQNNPQTLSVSVNAVPAHVPGHPGDFLGKCTQSCETVGYKFLETTGDLVTSEENGLSVIVYPNPFSDAFTLLVETSSPDPIQASLYDMTGKLIKRIQNITSEEPIEITTPFSDGIYFLIVSQGSNYQKVKVVKEQ